MQAYHNNPKLKESVLKELQHHYDHDNFIKGTYWENGKGCAVGCLLKSSNHIEYEEKFGIPIYMARLEDCIFEGLPNDKAKEWPIKFMSSFEVGKDYSDVIWDFLHWLLLEHLLPIIKQQGEVFDNVRTAIKNSANVLRNPNANAAAAADAADAAAYADAAAAAYAADAAAYAAAADAADAAAYADAAAAAYAADAAAYADAAAAAYADAAAAAYAADAAAYADAAAAADAAAYAARAYAADAAADAAAYADAAAAAAAYAADAAAAYIKFSSKLIELIERVK